MLHSVWLSSSLDIISAGPSANWNQCFVKRELALAYPRQLIFSVLIVFFKVLTIKLNSKGNRLSPVGYVNLLVLIETCYQATYVFWDLMDCNTEIRRL